MNEKALEKRGALDLAAAEIDEVAAAGALAFGQKQTGSFGAELAVARAVADMTRLLTPELMAPIMALQNSDLGFRTDRDPANIDSKTGKPTVPYDVEVVRRVFIESKLRGFHCVGNEFNIIAGRFYGGKSGFQRLVLSYPGLTNFRDSYDPPLIATDGKSALMKCRATWLMNGKPCSIGVDKTDELVISIRVNAYMGSDAVIGKCERKLYARVYRRLTGLATPEAEIGETPEALAPAGSSGFLAESNPAPAEPAAAPAQKVEAPAKGTIPFPVDKPAGGAVKRRKEPEPEDGADLGPEPGAAATPPEAAAAAPTAPAGGAEGLQPDSPQGALFAVVTDAGYSFAQFQRFCNISRYYVGSEKWTGYQDIPAVVADKLLASKAGLLRNLAALYPVKP